MGGEEKKELEVGHDFGGEDLALEAETDWEEGLGIYKASKKQTVGVGSNVEVGHDLEVGVDWGEGSGIFESKKTVVAGSNVEVGHDLEGGALDADAD